MAVCGTPVGLFIFTVLTLLFCTKQPHLLSPSLLSSCKVLYQCHSPAEKSLARVPVRVTGFSRANINLYFFIFFAHLITQYCALTFGLNPKLANGSVTKPSHLLSSLHMVLILAFFNTFSLVPHVCPKVISGNWIIDSKRPIGAGLRHCEKNWKYWCFINCNVRL